MDAGTALLVSVSAGLLLGATSSVVTRSRGVDAAIWFAIGVAIVGLAVITVSGEAALFPVVGAMLTFFVAASVLDPRPKGFFRQP